MDETNGQDESRQSAPSESDDAGATVDPAILDLDYVYDALSHSRRRYLCYSLHETTEWTLTDLAAKITAWERDSAVDEVTDRQCQRTYTSLYHAHVPKLVADDIVTFDRESETIQQGEQAEQVLRALAGIGASLEAEQESHARSGIDDGET